MNKRNGIYLKNGNFFFYNQELIDLKKLQICQKNKSFIFKQLEESKKSNRETIYSIYEEFDIEKYIYDILKNTNHSNNKFI